MLQERFTGVSAVSPASGIDRVFMPYLYKLLCTDVLKLEKNRAMSKGQHGFKRIAASFTLCLPVSSADINLGKQFGPRSGPKNRRA